MTAPFRLWRQVLLADTVTPCTPPQPCDSVSVENATADDLKVYATAEDAQADQHYAIVTVGDRVNVEIPRRTSFAHADGHGFSSKTPGLWVRSVPGGAVILWWF